ncbi:MAG: 6-hydroxymethylpterin diphosphokinase MptE-like protein, partial [Spirochaetia bacterium]
MRNNSIRVYDTGCGKQVEYCGKKLYSENPIDGVSRRVKAGIFSAETLYVIPSPLLGYGVEALHRKAGDNVDIILIEHDSELFKLYAEQDMKKYPAIFLPNAVSAQEYLSEIPYHKYRKIQMLRISGGYRIHPEFYRSLEAKLREELRRYWRNRITIIHMFRHWIKNSILNLALNSMNVKEITKGIKRPIVVFGAGESLEKCMEWVIKVRERVTVLAVDTALPALLAKNIFPDFVCALEAQAANLQDFISSKQASFHLYGDVSSYPNIFRILPGITWSFFSTIFAGNQFLKRCREYGLIRDSLPPLGSVGVTALELAHRLRQNGPIFLGGFDFSYRPGKTHSRGTYTHLLRMKASGRLTPMEWLPLREDAEQIPGKDNLPVVTDPVLKSYAELLEERAQGCGNVYDIGTQGIAMQIP